MATGSPFAPVAWKGRTLQASQCNNMYIFPGVGLGALVCKASRVPDSMFLAASKAISAFVTPEQEATGPRKTAAIPSNDTCAGALPISPTLPACSAVVADITDATTTGDPTLPSCQTNVSRSVWFTFTPSSTGYYRITTCADQGAATTVDDTVMAIYTSSGGCAGPFTEIPFSARNTRTRRGLGAV